MKRYQCTIQRQDTFQSQQNPFVGKQGGARASSRFKASQPAPTWTIMSGTWNHLRQRNCGTEEEVMRFIKKEVEYQGKIEAAGYCSPTWRLPRALRDLLNATYLQGESAVTAPPFFDGAGRGVSPFWGTAKGPTVILWDSLDEEGRTKSETIIRERRDWVVWARTRQDKNDKTTRAFEKRSRVLFAGSVREQNQNDEGPSRVKGHQEKEPASPQERRGGGDEVTSQQGML